MKKIILLLIISLLISCNLEKKKPLVGKTEFQIEINNEYKDASKSPLTKEDLKNFKGLDFFPVNKNLKVIATLKKTPNTAFFKMKTTGTKLNDERIFGVLTFQIDGKTYQLNTYQGKRLMKTKGLEDYLFLPFTDLTNGKTTYAAGRYIDLRIPKGNTVEIDFNKAYNPYCAYNSKYSCPIVPKENNLNIEINAGVKAFKKH